MRIHPFFWLMAVLLGLRGAPESANMAAWLVDLLVWVVAVFVVILVHELGHAAVMRAYGFSPWITLYGFGGLASYNPAHTYGSKGTGTLGQIVISAAGPGAGFLLAAGLALVLYLAGPGFRYGFLLNVLPVVRAPDLVGSPVLTEFIDDIFFICVFWGYINLLPVYPLDGGHISREIFLRVNPREGIVHSLRLSMFTGAAMAVVGLLQWHSFFVAFFFGWMAYSSYAALQAYRSRGPW